MKTIPTRPSILLSVFNAATSALPVKSRSKSILMSVAIALGIILSHGDARAAGPILNYTLKALMENTGIDEDARGTVNSVLNRNAKGDNQRLKVVLAKLDPDTAYQLNAFIGNDTAPTPVASFTTDSRGGAALAYSQNRQGTAGRGTELLPTSLDPLCDAREFEIVNGDGQQVLRALMATSTGRRYVVSRPLVNSGFISSAAGTLKITGSTRATQFRLKASGLDPATDYLLSVNGGAGQTLTTDGAGKLKLTTLPAEFVNAFDIHTLALSDTSGNLILSTDGMGLPCNLESGNPPDTTPPTVSSTDPANAVTGVPLNQSIRATFSEDMNPATIDSTTVTLRQGATPVTGTVTYAGNTASFTPAANLAPNTVYTATIGTGATDLAGNALANEVVWSFTTGTTSDTTAPTVSATVPANAATGVPVNQNIQATFSEAMDVTTINGSTLTLRQGATPVAGTVTYAGNTATFTPSANLAPNTVYTARITTGARDLAGNGLASDVVWTFTTGTPADSTAPTVSSTVPAASATGVSVSQNVQTTFSEAMDASTINTTTVTLRRGATPVAGTVTYSGNTATFTPASSLSPNTVYTARITTGARDLAGNGLASDVVWSFTTGTPADTTAPTVSSTVPAAGATGVSVSQNLQATFSEAMDASTINTTTVTLRRGATPVAGTVTYSGNTATFTPSANLAPNTVYTARITTGARDLAGNALADNFVWTFTTAGSPTAQTPVPLGTAGRFAVLAGSTVTSTGFTVINNGDVGVSPGTNVVGLEGFPSGSINNGTIHAGDATAAQGQTDLTTAYNDAAGRAAGAVTVSGNLGGQTLTPGLYKSTSSLEISSGDLTLDAQGDPNAVFIFQIPSNLTVTSNRSVFLSGNAKAANVFWQVGSSAALGTISVFKGNIMAAQSITLATGAHLEGRALARTGAVTLEASTVTVPAP